MATIRKRGEFQWQAQVRKRGYPVQSKTFLTKQEAQAWAAVLESEMVRGVFISRTEAENTTLGALIDWYLKEITPTHKGYVSEEYRLRTLRKDPLAARFVANLRSGDFANYRDARLAKVKPATVERELTMFHQIIEHARREWDIALPDNPLKLVKRPRYNNERQRRLTSEEEKVLMEAVEFSGRNADGTYRKGVHNPWLKPVVIIALETAMRQSEIASLLRKNVNLAKGVALLPDTKNGSSRAVPLSKRARDVLARLPRPIDGRVFPVTPNAIKLAWQRAVKGAGLQDLHFHDLRHEATSRC